MIINNYFARLLSTNQYHLEAHNHNVAPFFGIGHFSRIFQEGRISFL